MKQYTTREQWNELNDNEKINFITSFPNRKHHWADEHEDLSQFDLLSIGQILEFLGDSFINLSLSIAADGKRVWFMHIKGFRSAGHKEPIDAGWEAVRFNLANKIISK